MGPATTPRLGVRDPRSSAVAIVLAAPVWVVLSCSPPDAGDDSADEPSDACAQPGSWHTDGQRIIDPDCRQRILRGMNISNDAKWPPEYDSWAVEEDYARLQEWGFSAARMMISWAAIMPERGVIDEEYLARVDQRVAWAGDHDIAVILDMHQDVYGEGFISGGGNGAPTWSCDQALYDAFEPTSPWYMNYLHESVRACYDQLWRSDELLDLYTEAFVALAARYADEPAVIGYDLFNEPYWGNTEIDEFHRDDLQRWYEHLMDALDAVAPGRLYFVEPCSTVQLGLQPAFAPFDGDRVVYAPHYYHTGVHDDHVWDADPEPVEEILATFQETAEDLGIPWWMGEWGGYTDSVNFDAYLRTLEGIYERDRVGAAYYDYSADDGGFSPLNTDHSEKEHVVDVLARVYPRAVSGRLVQVAFDDVEGTFRMTVTSVAGLDPAAELAFPHGRHYPDGYTVACSDPAGSWEAIVDDETATLRVTFDPAREEHELTIAPAAR